MLMCSCGHQLQNQNKPYRQDSKIADKKPQTTMLLFDHPRLWGCKVVFPFPSLPSPLVGCCLALREMFLIYHHCTQQWKCKCFSWNTYYCLWLILTDTSQCLLLMIVLQKLNWLECNSPCLTSASGQYFSRKFQLEQPAIFKKDYVFLFTFFPFLSRPRRLGSLHTKI